MTTMRPGNLRAGCRRLVLLAVAVGPILLGDRAWSADPDAAGQWPCVGRDPGGTRFSPLTEINPENVSKLQLAWTYRTGELERVKGSPLANKVAFEATPLMIDGVLYFSTATGHVFALDGGTGQEIWKHDSKMNMRLFFAEGASRGVSFWKSSDSPARRRVFMGTLGARLLAIDADTGQACDDFGDHGSIDLAAGLPRTSRGLYAVTSPPAIVGDVVVVGSAIGDNQRTDTSPGVVRAFDAKSGQLLWSWDPVPRSSDESNAATWKGAKALETGAANVWSIISADTERGLVFLPTSCPSPDFYGGERLGNNLYANSVVALEAKTGKRVWNFQVVHHDIWDYDVAAQPVLFTLTRDGKRIPAVAIGTKTGHVFVLHRETGEPLFPVDERPVPKSDVAGEEASPTQPFSALPAVGLQNVEPWGPTDAEMQLAKEHFATFRYEGIFTPPSLQGTVVAPANVGGINWSGMSVDVDRQILVTNVNRLASVVRLIPRAEFSGARGSRLGEEFGPQAGTPYGMARRIFRAPDKQLPASKPPWGTLVAIDLVTGKLRWEVPLGFMVDPGEEPRATEWGSINLGGAITTASGLTVIAASRDGHLRAFDTNTGKELWRIELPAGGQATPMTYRDPKSGKQFVVIAAGGHARLGTKLGDYIVAFSLP